MAAGHSLSALLPRVGAVRNLGPTSWQLADTAAGCIDAFWQAYHDDEGGPHGGFLPDDVADEAQSKDHSSSPSGGAPASPLLGARYRKDNTGMSATSVVT